MNKKQKKGKKKYIIIILAIIVIIGFAGDAIADITFSTIANIFLSDPKVSYQEKKEVKEFSRKYLEKKYGDHNYKIKNVRYEYQMQHLFDYSNPTGYWVDFKSDIVPSCWLVIKGLKKEDFIVEGDYLFTDYYFPDLDGYEAYEAEKKLIPKKKIENIILSNL